MKTTKPMWMAIAILMTAVACYACYKHEQQKKATEFWKQQYDYLMNEP